MKASIFILLTSIVLCCCTGVSPEKIVYTEDFLAENKEWQATNNSFDKEFQIGFENIQEPMRISWTTARDQTGCLRIANLKFENINKESQLQIRNVRTSSKECGMKFDSEDSTRFESLVLSADYSTLKTFQVNQYRGSVITIMGNGEYQITKEH
jgi:hypothetical protein